MTLVKSLHTTNRKLLADLNGTQINTDPVPRYSAGTEYNKL